jgi:heme O synthase-like polyprenyltransferase
MNGYASIVMDWLMVGVVAILFTFCVIILGVVAYTMYKELSRFWH